MKINAGIVKRDPPPAKVFKNPAQIPTNRIIVTCKRFIRHPPVYVIPLYYTTKKAHQENKYCIFLNANETDCIVSFYVPM